MSGSYFAFSKTGLLMLGICLLSGCSGRDPDSAEHLAEINAAAARAEKAAERAEAAVAKLQQAGAPVPEIEPEVEEPSPEDVPVQEDQPVNQP